MGIELLNNNTPIEWVLTTQLKQPPERAKMIAAGFQVAAILALLAMLFVLAEWRFVTFEKYGCRAFCNCTARMIGMNYSFEV